MPAPATAAVDVIETAYRDLSAPDSAWLSGLRTSAMRFLGDAAWVTVAHVEVDERRTFRTHAIAAEPAQLESHEHWHASASAELLSAIYFRGPFSRLGPLIAGSEWEPVLHATGTRDVVGAVGLDPNGRGIVLSYGTISPRVPARRRWTMERIAAHLASAGRLRASAPHEDAVLDASGRLLDARAGADRSRDVLRDAARRIDRARSRRTSDEERVELWNALVEGRWSLVEKFDTDGRRMFVARRNPPTASRHVVLEPDERTVVALIALGRPMKVVAYELGRSAAWVSRTLARGLAKLGLPSRAALVDLHGALVGVGVTP